MSATPTTWAYGSAYAPGTCGELAQGVLPGGQRFHVTCPIDRGVRVRLRVRPAARTELRGIPEHAWKTGLALARATELLHLGPSEIEVIAYGTHLEEAKGMASSTADMVASVSALASAVGTDLPAPELARLAASIEPTDGTMHGGVVLADHQTGERIGDWEWAPRFTIAMFVPPERRFTTSSLHPGQRARGPEYAGLLADLDAAVGEQDHAAFADAATRSAAINEGFVPNPSFGVLAHALPATGALGLCVGHSGTVAGLLFMPDREGEERARAAIEALRLQLAPGVSGTVVRNPPSHGRPVPTEAECVRTAAGG